MDAVDKVDVVDEASEQTDGSWERKMVEIRMADGGGRMQVSAWVRGCWAIHPWGQHPRLCVLTHVPTGRRMPWRLRHVCHACRLASGLDALTDWSKVRRGGLSSELSYRCVDVAKAAGVYD